MEPKHSTLVKYKSQRISAKWKTEGLALGPRDERLVIFNNGMGETHTIHTGENASRIFLLVFIYRLSPPTRKECDSLGKDTLKELSTLQVSRACLAPSALCRPDHVLNNLLLLHSPPSAADPPGENFPTSDLCLSKPLISIVPPHSPRPLLWPTSLLPPHW